MTTDSFIFDNLDFSLQKTLDALCNLHKIDLEIESTFKELCSVIDLSIEQLDAFDMELRKDIELKRRFLEAM